MDTIGWCSRAPPSTSTARRFGADRLVEVPALPHRPIPLRCCWPVTFARAPSAIPAHTGPANPVTNGGTDGGRNANRRQKKSRKASGSAGFLYVFGGKPGIRTLGTLLTFAGFQDRYAKSSGPMCWGRTAFHNSLLAAKLQALFYKGNEFSLGTDPAPSGARRLTRNSGGSDEDRRAPAISASLRIKVDWAGFDHPLVIQVAWLQWHTSGISWWI